MMINNIIPVSEMRNLNFYFIDGKNVNAFRILSAKTNWQRVLFND